MKRLFVPEKQENIFCICFSAFIIIHFGLEQRHTREYLLYNCSKGTKKNAGRDKLDRKFVKFHKSQEQEAEKAFH